MFTVFDIIGRTSKVMDFDTLCSTYPEANLMLLKEGCISIVSIYNGGKKIAVINKVREDKGSV